MGKGESRINAITKGTQKGLVSANPFCVSLFIPVFIQIKLDLIIRRILCIMFIQTKGDKYVSFIKKSLAVLLAAMMYFSVVSVSFSVQADACRDEKRRQKYANRV